MKLKYPNSLPFICTGIAAIPFLCYYFALMFGELFFGRPSSTWVIGFVWIPFLVFRPALIGLIVGFIIWMVFHWLKISGEIQKKGLYSLLALLILISISSVALGFKEVFEHEDYYAPRIVTGKDLLQKEQFLVNDKLIEIRSTFVRTIQATGMRSDLTVFDPDGKLVYHEIFKASYLAIAPLRQKEKELDSLLIGENSKVWLYNMRIHN